MSLLNILRKIDYRVFFPFLSEDAYQKYYVQNEHTTYPFEEGALNASPLAVQTHFRHCAMAWERKKFHFIYTDGCTVEPALGWGVTNADELIPQSLWNNYTGGVKPSYLKYKLLPKKKIHLKVAIALHYGWTNYWHFYNDILGQLRIADEAGVPDDTPIIIPAGLAQRSYFKEIISMSADLQKREWILQDSKTNIYCDNIHFFNTFYAHRKNLDAVLDYIGFYQNIQSSTVGNERIFVSRNKARGRNIANLEEVQAILKKYSFKIVDCDNLSVRQQIDVFQNAKNVIAIHGAGLTNIAYRQGREMNLLELFSADYMNPTYFLLCQQYDYAYYSIAGTGVSAFSSSADNFTIDVDEFEGKVRAMLGL